jgi:hypothetical protein
MVPATPPSPTPNALPETLRRWFWDCDFDQLTWEEHRDFLIRRILSLGTWDAVCWVRVKVGDFALREWIEQHHGRGLSSQQLRFWGVILDLAPSVVDAWLASPERKIWEGRTHVESSR